MPKPVAAFDVDGIFLDFMGYLLPYANAKLGTDLTYDQIIWFDPAASFDVSTAVFKRIHDDFHLEVFRHDDMPIIAGSTEALQLIQTEFELVFLTAAQEHLVEVRTELLTRTFPGSTVHFTNGHGTILDHNSKRVSKLEKALELGAVCMVDDNPHEAEAWDTDQVQLICFAQPWNASILTTHPHIPRLDWPGILALLLPVRV